MDPGEGPARRPEDSPRPTRCRAVASYPFAPKTASGSMPRSSGPKMAIRSCSRTASPAPSGCGPTRSRTSPTTIASSRTTIAGTARAPCPARRRGYGLDHLAGDLDAVLETTLAPGERAVIAGHSMGGIAITSWAKRYPDRVPQRADAVALINTTTGDLLRNVQFLPVPPPLADVPDASGGTLLKTFGAAPLLRAVDRPSRRFVSTIAVGRDADPAVAESSTSCSPRHHPQAVPAGPERWLTRSVPSTSG